jgi:hypothetical protein
MISGPNEIAVGIERERGKQASHHARHGRSSAPVSFVWYKVAR